MHDFCWNDHYTPTPVPPGVPTTVAIVLDATNAGGMTIGCPETPAEVARLNAELASISTKLNQASNGVIQRIVWQQYTPASCVPVSSV